MNQASSGHLVSSPCLRELARGDVCTVPWALVSPGSGEMCLHSSFSAPVQRLLGTGSLLYQQPSDSDERFFPCLGGIPLQEPAQRG